jgi:hypothetical protein
LRHIASGDQVPIGAGVLQCCKYSPQRSFARIKVGNRGVAKTGVAGGVTYQGGAAGSFRDRAGDRLRQCAAAKRQQGLIASHAGTAPTHQHVSRCAHSKMITLRFPRPWFRIQRRAAEMRRKRRVSKTMKSSPRFSPLLCGSASNSSALNIKVSICIPRHRTF